MALVSLQIAEQRNSKEWPLSKLFKPSVFHPSSVMTVENKTDLTTAQKKIKLVKYRSHRLHFHILATCVNDNDNTRL